MTRNEYLLTVLAEECVETAQRVSKALRFSLEEIQPEQDLTNAERIIYEFNDIVAVMEILRDEGVLSRVIDEKAILDKKIKVAKYLEYSSKMGTIQENTK